MVKGLLASEQGEGDVGHELGILTPNTIKKNRSAYLHRVACARGIPSARRRRDGQHGASDSGRRARTVGVMSAVR